MGKNSTWDSPSGGGVILNSSLIKKFIDKEREMGENTTFS